MLPIQACAASCTDLLRLHAAASLHVFRQGIVTAYTDKQVDGTGALTRIIFQDMKHVIGKNWKEKLLTLMKLNR